MLKAADKKILTSEACLNDAVINASQTLLKKQTTTYVGFQNTLLGVNLGYKAIERGKPFIQILHSNGNHWITSTNAGCAAGAVKVFDSAAYTYLTLRDKQQICSFIRPEDSQIKFQLVNMQVQPDSVSCGLFAIAVATELVHNKDPSRCMWDVDQMRKHLVQCLESQQLLPFPLVRERRVCPGSPFRKVIVEKIFCKCRMPRDPRVGMDLQCSACLKQYHATCYGLKELPGSGQKWTCHACT